MEGVESQRAWLPAPSSSRDDGRWHRLAHELEYENRALRDALSRTRRVLTESAMRALLGDGGARWAGSEGFGGGAVADVARDR